MKKTWICSLLTLCMLSVTPGTAALAATLDQDHTSAAETTSGSLPDTGPQDQPVSAEEPENTDISETETTDTPVYIPDLTMETAKKSSKSIQISWDSPDDYVVSEYYLMRRSVKNSIGKGNWKTLATLASKGRKEGASYSYTDSLKSSEPQQYEYKICTLSADQTTDTRDAAYESQTNDTAVLGSNIKICIDPGHYGTLNNNYELTGADGNYPYSEAVFNLEVAKSLQTELKQFYGIDSFLTRTGESVSLKYNGKTYKNENLDQKNIAVRGYAAKQQGCDFFVSLHTNSTSRPSKPWSQPKSINKAYVFVNQVAHASDRGMLIANTIGKSLTDYNKQAGIQTSGFITRSKNKAAAFSNLNNDSAKTNGTVVHRRSSSGGDYYGVLRGASADGTPGILIEHAFHATQIVRKRAGISSELSESWAECDAYGIAVGFGFLES